MLIRLKTLRHRSAGPSLTLLLAPYAPPSVGSLPTRLECRPVRGHAGCAEPLPQAVEQSA